MSRVGSAVVLLCAVLVLSACTRISDGTPTGVAQRGAPTATSDAPATETVTPGPQEDDPGPGMMPTTEPAPAGSICAPADLSPVRTVARVAEPGAPTATVGVPDGWSMSSGDGDQEGARLEGSAGMEAVVIIAPTPLDPEAAFRKWSDDLTRDATVSVVSMLPGDMCGYSGQIQTGSLSDHQQSVEYRDRLVHVPAAAGDYLIVVHTEAPAGAPGYDEAARLITGDFEIGLP